jgi:hypothetical protein
MAPTPGPGAAVAARAFVYMDADPYPSASVLCAACGHHLTQLPAQWIVTRVIPLGRPALPIRRSFAESIIVRCRRRGRECGVFNEIVLVLPSAA